eukprot:733827_1
MSFSWTTVILAIISTTNSESITYKKGECEVSSIKKDECGFWGWGDYYEYTLTPICDSDSNTSPSQCIYDDSNGKTDCEAWGDYDVNDKRSCWIKYIDNKCISCDCTDCDDDSAGTCEFDGGCVDKFTNELVYPKTIKVSDGETLQMKSIYFENVVYDPDESGKSMIEYTGRVLCINDICSIPGPTLIVEPGITFHFQIENGFDVNVVNKSDAWGADVTNIHSHGLHISGEQDNVFESLFPTESHLDTWTIHPEHHLGTNWYHMHHHTSVFLQVMQGMYGALIVDSPQNRNNLDYDDPSKTNDYILHISWQFIHDNSHCQNCADFLPNIDKFEFMDSWKLISSMCTGWCNTGVPGAYTDKQREQSGWVYDVMIADGWENNADYIDVGDYPAFEGFLVNNLYQPYISCVDSNQYFKLRIIAASAQIYMQVHFDYNQQTDCEYFLIARDGIALKDGSRNLADKPYYGYFLVPPGGRIDVKAICFGSGTVRIWHREFHPEHPSVNISYPMSRIDDQLLFTMSIKQSSDSKITDYEHLDYPEPIHGFPYYMQEVMDQNSYSSGKGGGSKGDYSTDGSKGDSTKNSEGSSNSDSSRENEYSECICSNYNRSQTEDPLIRDTNVCGLEFNEGVGKLAKIGDEVNGVAFDADRSLFILSKNVIYDFYINSDGHPMHIHVNPIMVMEDLLDGYVAQQYDWMDTIGYREYPYLMNGTSPTSGFKVKFYTRDFVGNVILHCHFLEHEDAGMMGWMKIVDGPTDDLAYCERNYGFQNDYMDTPIMLPNIMPNNFNTRG